MVQAADRRIHVLWQQRGAGCRGPVTSLPLRQRGRRRPPAAADPCCCLPGWRSLRRHDGDDEGLHRCCGARSKAGAGVLE